MSRNYTTMADIFSTTDQLSNVTNEELVAAILRRIDERTHKEPGMAETPLRVVKSWKELFGGYREDPAKHFKTFASKCNTMVVVSDIEFYSTCEHHMQPFFGTAHIGYIPDGRVLGLSKVARVLDVFARRFQIQERIGEQIVEAMTEHLKPKGVMCVLEAKHLCMCARGVSKQHSVTLTSALSGVFEQAAVRAEFMALVEQRRGAR